MSIAASGVGDAVCAATGCSEHDFLPSKCDKCAKTFCSAHASYAAHSCSHHVDRRVPDCPLCGRPVSIPQGQTPDAAVARHMDLGCPRDQAVVSRLNFCSVPGCRTNEHVTILCRGCGNQYCISHRNEDAHDCRVLRKSPPPKPTGQRTPPRSPPRSPKGGGTSLGFPDVVFGNTADSAAALVKSHEPSECVRLRVFFPPGEGFAPLHMLCHRSWVVGRVLDACCNHVGVLNENNRSTEDKRLRLFHLHTFVELTVSARVGEVTADGDAVLLMRAKEIPDGIIAEAMQHLWPVEREQRVSQPSPQPPPRPP
eukprot:Hpha_TRINITY_DN16469_c2_g1::TRINITY_DN16469_c2_g1_i1::g.162056::m.162056